MGSLLANTTICVGPGIASAPILTAGLYGPCTPATPAGWVVDGRSRCRGRVAPVASGGAEAGGGDLTVAGRFAGLGPLEGHDHVRGPHGDDHLAGVQVLGTPSGPSRAWPTDRSR